MRASAPVIDGNTELSRERARDSTSSAPLSPRLLDLRAAAHYTGLSTWTLREFLLSGELPVVRFTRPGSQRREDLRRVLIDRADLDVWIDGHRRRGAV
jgi:hypothetical protein